MNSGELVVVWRDNGEALITKTRSNSWMLNSVQEVVQVKGISGSYTINNVRKMTIHDSVIPDILKLITDSAGHYQEP